MLAPGDKSKISDGSIINTNPLVRVPSESKIEKEKEIIENMNNDEDNHFNIRSIQIIYKMEFSRRILERIIKSSE